MNSPGLRRRWLWGARRLNAAFDSPKSQEEENQNQDYHDEQEVLAGIPMHGRVRAHEPLDAIE
jgi:hypothetical protein